MPLVFGRRPRPYGRPSERRLRRHNPTTSIRRRIALISIGFCSATARSAIVATAPNAATPTGAVAKPPPSVRHERPADRPDTRRQRLHQPIVRSRNAPQRCWPGRTATTRTNDRALPAPPDSDRDDAQRVRPHGVPPPQPHLSTTPRAPSATRTIPTSSLARPTGDQ